MQLHDGIYDVTEKIETLLEGIPPVQYVAVGSCGARARPLTPAFATKLPSPGSESRLRSTENAERFSESDLR